MWNRRTVWIQRSGISRMAHHWGLTHGETHGHENRGSPYWEVDTINIHTVLIACNEGSLYYYDMLFFLKLSAVEVLTKMGWIMETGRGQTQQWIKTDDLHCNEWGCHRHKENQYLYSWWNLVGGLTETYWRKLIENSFFWIKSHWLIPSAYLWMCGSCPVAVPTIDPAPWPLGRGDFSLAQMAAAND